MSYMLLLFVAMIALAGVCLGQTSFAGLMPGKNSRDSAQLVLGQPVKEISPTLAEYSPQGLSGRIFVQYRESGLIERIELLCKTETTGCDLALKGLRVSLPANESVTEYDKDKWRLLYGSPLLIGIGGSLAEETHDAIPSRIIFYSRELYDAEFEAVTAQNRSEYVKGGSTLFRAGILNGKAIQKPDPVYPAAARAVRASGIVRVEVSTDETGKVVGRQAVEGHPLLRGAAEIAAEKARISPTVIAGKPVRVVGTLTYDFR